MSISSPQSPGPPAEDWDALVALETSRQQDIDAAFDRADACEREGYFRLAREWLDRAGELSGGLSPACRAQRNGLAAKVHAGGR
jgi:hypothetical protein